MYTKTSNKIPNQSSLRPQHLNPAEKTEEERIQDSGKESSDSSLYTAT